MRKLLIRLLHSVTPLNTLLVAPSKGFISKQCHGSRDAGDSSEDGEPIGEASDRELSKVRRNKLGLNIQISWRKYFMDILYIQLVTSSNLLC